MQHNKQYHMKVLLNSFHLNGHILGFYLRIKVLFIILLFMLKTTDLTLWFAFWFLAGILHSVPHQSWLWWAWAQHLSSQSCIWHHVLGKKEFSPGFQNLSLSLICAQQTCAQSNYTLWSAVGYLGDDPLTKGLGMNLIFNQKSANNFHCKMCCKLSRTARDCIKWFKLMMIVLF